MELWRIWHPTYGVIYDEVQVSKRGMYALSTQQARPGAIHRHGRAILSFDGSHRKNFSVHAVDTSSCASQRRVTMSSSWKI
jgi:hypothetical protein